MLLRISFFDTRSSSDLPQGKMPCTTSLFYFSSKIKHSGAMKKYVLTRGHLTWAPHVTGARGILSPMSPSSYATGRGSSWLHFFSCVRPRPTSPRALYHTREHTSETIMWECRADSQQHIYIMKDDDRTHQLDTIRLRRHRHKCSVCF